MSASSLPSQPTSFIGREDELAQIANLLLAPDCRLLTLTGPGGIGKTRLALEAATLQPDNFSNGVYFVPLQPLTSPDFMVSTIADSLKISFYGEQNPRTQLLDYLSTKHLLLVLDNFEHLLDGVDLLADMLDAAADVKLLVTSRERLRLREEWVLEVGGLDYPPSEIEADIEHYSAVELFLRHARRANASFVMTDGHKPAIIRICRLVGGMPLGVELAAAWVRVLSCEVIAEEIARNLNILETSARNVEPRHRTMRAAFEPTWNRLSIEERSVFIKLSIFRGGFTREAAEHVAGAALPILSALVDKSLLRLDADGRYTIHELLRQYSAERLNEFSEEVQETHNRHCSYYTHLLEQCWPRLTGSEIKSALQDIRTELDNLRAAWDWAVRHHKAQEIEAALDSLWFFYDQGNRYQEGEQVFASAASILKAREQEGLFAKVIARQGALCRMVLLLDRSRALLQESVALLRPNGASLDLAFALARLAIVTPGESKGVELLEQSLAVYTELDNRWGMGQVLDWLCVYKIDESIRQDSREILRRAEQYALEGLAINQQLGSPYGIALACLSMGKIAYSAGEHRQAREYYQQSLDTFQDIGIYWGILYSLRSLGNCACALGEFADARYFSLQALRVVPDPAAPGSVQFTYPQLAVVAEIWLGEGEIERAYELVALVDQWRQKMGFPKKPIEFHVLSRLDEELPPSLMAAVERGRMLDFDTVVKAVIKDLTRSVENPLTQPALSSPQLLPDPLTERELEILHLLADGMNSREVAQRLVLSVGTIRWYLKHIYGKLDAHSRSEAIARARALNLLM